LIAKELIRIRSTGKHQVRFPSDFVSRLNVSLVEFERFRGGFSKATPLE
jgi:hypothetical protein